MQNIIFLSNDLYTPVVLPINNFVLINPGDYSWFPNFNLQNSPQIEATFNITNAINACNQAQIQSTERVDTSKQKQVISKVKKPKKKERDFESQEEEFQVDLKRPAPQIIYKKKNTESNIVNQTFSYLSTEKSKKDALMFIKDEQTFKEFYKLMKKVKQSNKKYINRKYLKRLIEFADGSQFSRIFNKLKSSHLTLEDIRKNLRRLTYNFLKNESTLTLLTSSKIYKQTLPEHFWRKREIIAFLFETESK